MKAAITGYGSADKRQVQAMVARILRLDELPKPADAADALALALCHAWRTGSGRSAGERGSTDPRSARLAGCRAAGASLTASVSVEQTCESGP